MRVRRKEQLRKQKNINRKTQDTANIELKQNCIPKLCSPHVQINYTPTLYWHNKVVP
mgnify:CR=1 FL=1